MAVDHGVRSQATSGTLLKRDKSWAVGFTPDASRSMFCRSASQVPTRRSWTLPDAPRPDSSGHEKTCQIDSDARRSRRPRRIDSFLKLRIENRRTQCGNQCWSVPRLVWMVRFERAALSGPRGSIMSSFSCALSSSDRVKPATGCRSPMTS